MRVYIEEVGAELKGENRVEKDKDFKFEIQNPLRIIENK